MIHLLAWFLGGHRPNHCIASARQLFAAKKNYFFAEERWRKQFLRRGDGFDSIAALRACMEKLTDRTRLLLERCYKKRLSRCDLAREFRMTENGIKAFLRRVRTLLGGCVETSIAEQIRGGAE